MGYRFQISILLALSITATIASAQTPASKFQIRVEGKKNEKDQEISPATLQQIRARQLATQQHQQSSAEYYSEEDDDDENVPAPQTYHRQTQAPQRQYQPQQQQQQQHYQQQQQRKQPLSKKQREEFEKEIEEEEPDHLALLLEESKFSCNERTTGYYADDTVECKVFHYCQDNTKHSWICPEGATFHQVHLICMPPSDENICQQSSKYHFVNDYLYKPINMEEYQSKPNVSLRYHERYYPENIYHDDRSEYDEERERAPVRHQPKPVVRTQQQNAYRQQQNAYRSPDEINISLQQRRPYFAQTTTRYEDEEQYNYEK
ncbi:trichohyalin [Chironomus tepperi]|uniref:trichohyalin n=1 Tax=Chironomus tepperi TaxID=113505 RepID=UPI00391FB70C